MILSFVSKFTSIFQARAILECLEVLAKHFEPHLFKDTATREEAIDSAIAFLQSLKEPK